LPKGQYKPPQSGEAPEGLKEILASTYISCREKNPGEIKSRKRKCAKIAWGAAKKKYRKCKCGKWVLIKQMKAKKRRKMHCPDCGEWV